ncbi:restriction endonuclease subunit S [Shewanella oncorhynchi]|uniref:restriction endonuclease subunit S n=1 Tax=Shewanella oncorhynchi TaxID=2726434 RepID=UPI003D79DFDE
MSEQAELNSKYVAYSEYKDSGIIWSGFTPSHWEQIRFKHVFVEKQKKSNIELPAGSISFGQVVYKDEDKLAADTKASYQEVKVGEFLVNPLNLNFDLKSLRTALSDIDVVVSTGYIVLQCYSQLDAKFARWLLHEFDVAHMKSLGAGVRQTIGFNDIGNSYFCKPPLEEQRTIAAFLDYETARIDQLIAKQQRLIELLKEKRQAVISHAVTKGLNPNASMKDSGVEWLGQVPEHWVMKKFSYCASIRNGQVNPTTSPYNQYALIAPNHIESGTGKLLGLETAEEQGADSGKYLCKKGEVIYSKIRPALAKVCISPIDNVICSADMYPINAKNGLVNQFLYYFLLSEPFTRFAVNQADRVAMPKINRESLADCRIPVPPLDEQQAIVMHVSKQSEKLEVLIVKALLTISLMQERRTALISAAVTGKIDLRGWSQPNA